MKCIHDVSQSIMDDRRKRLSRVVTNTSLRDRAEDFQDNVRKTVDWMMGKRDLADNTLHKGVENQSRETPKPMLRRSSGTDEEPRSSPNRKQLLRRRSSAFL